jgi:antagonist of KipI
MVLMADHQTTGGYPRVATVISAHLPLLAQLKPGEEFSLALTNVESAEKKLLQQFNYLQRVQYAAGFKIEKILQ